MQNEKKYQALFDPFAETRTTLIEATVSGISDFCVLTTPHHNNRTFEILNIRGAPLTCRTGISAGLHRPRGCVS